MLERTALDGGEDGLVDRLGQVRDAEDHAASGTAQGLVSGGRHHLRMRDGTRVDACRDEACEVGHVRHQDGSHLVGDLAESREVP